MKELVTVNCRGTLLLFWGLPTSVPACSSVSLPDTAPPSSCLGGPEPGCQHPGNRAGGKEEGPHSLPRHPVFILPPSVLLCLLPAGPPPLGTWAMGWGGGAGSHRPWGPQEGLLREYPLLHNRLTLETSTSGSRSHLWAHGFCKLEFGQGTGCAFSLLRADCSCLLGHLQVTSSCAWPSSSLAGRPLTVSTPERELGSCCIAHHDLFPGAMCHLFHPILCSQKSAQVQGQAAWTLVLSRGTSLLSCHWSTWPGALTDAGRSLLGSLVPQCQLLHSSTVSCGPFSCREFASSCWVPWVISKSSSLCTFQNLSGVFARLLVVLSLFGLCSFTLLGFEEEGL